MNCDVCICKELYAECRVVGGTAVFQELVERVTRFRFQSSKYDVYSLISWQSLVSLNSDYKFMRQSMEAEGTEPKPVIVYLKVCKHEVPLVMSPVMQATEWQIVHIWVWLHLMLPFAYSGEPLPTHSSTKFTTVWRGSDGIGVLRHDRHLAE